MTEAGRAAALYEPLPLFAVRAPVAPIDALFDGGPPDTAPALDVDAMLEEAVAIAAPAAFDELTRARAAPPPRRRERLDRTLRRYRSRMSARATPFGLFAGVTPGRFGSPSAASLGPADSVRKRTRPDMGWLLAVVRDLEARDDVLDGLRVARNRGVHRVGSRLVVASVSAWGDPDGVEPQRRNVSVRASPPVLRALDLSDGTRTVRTLVADLGRELPAAGADRLRKLIRGLVDNEILVTELVPPLGGAPLDHVIEVLERVAPSAHELSHLLELRRQLERYDATPLGAGLPGVVAIREHMASLRATEKSVHVDTAFSGATVVLPPAIGRDVARAAEWLWRMSPPRIGSPALAEYHQSFLERYSFDRQVPLLDLLDESTGLGLPPGYDAGTEDAVLDETGPPSEHGRLLAELLMIAALRGDEELVLTDELLEQLGYDGDPSTAPQSVDVFAEVVTAHDGGFEVVLSSMPISVGAGQACGRFADVLGGDMRDQLADRARAEDAQLEPAIVAELVHLPPHGRLANLIQAARLRRYAVADRVLAECDDAIPLDEVTVYASSERLHLSSRRHECELVVTAAHLVNHRTLAPACRFVLEVSHAHLRFPGPLGSDAPLDLLPRIPRVRLGRAILARATWRATAAAIDAAAGDASSWRERFDAWRRACDVPRHVELSWLGEHLLLDLSLDAHVDDVRRELERRGRVTLVEPAADPSRRPLRGPAGHHVMECVFPLARRPVAKPHRHAPLPEPRPAAVDERTRLPGSDWLYLELHATARRHDDLVTRHVAPFAERALAAGHADLWFYLRYSLGGPHLRLRFHGDPNRLLALLAQTEPWARELIACGALTKIAVATYERELERYGGPDAMPLAESVFAADSRLCVGMLAASAGAAPPLPATALAALGAVDLLDAAGGFGPDLDATVDHALAKGQLTRELKRAAAGLWLPDLIGLVGAPHERLAALGPLFASRGATVARYRDAVEATCDPERMRAIAGSLVHMHCNRLMGPAEAEQRALALAAQISRWRETMRARPAARAPARART